MTLLLLVSTIFGYTEPPVTSKEQQMACFTDRGYKVDTANLMRAVQTGKLDIVKCVHENGVSLNQVSFVGMSKVINHDGSFSPGKYHEGVNEPIEWAIMYNYLDIVEYIVSHRISIYSITESNTLMMERTLKYASKHRNQKAVEIAKKYIRIHLDNHFKVGPDSEDEVEIYYLQEQDPQAVREKCKVWTTSDKDFNWCLTAEIISYRVVKKRNR